MRIRRWAKGGRADRGQAGLKPDPLAKLILFRFGGIDVCRCATAGRAHSAQETSLIGNDRSEYSVCTALCRDSAISSEYDLQ